MADDSEQNKSEDATPFKLKRARDKGQVARSMEIGAFGGLIAIIAFLLVAGVGTASALSGLIKSALATGIQQASDPQVAPDLIRKLYASALRPVLLLGTIVLLVVLLLELIQLRGIVVSTHPLKPDFSRLNPAKGLKRVFSMRMVKETVKAVIKTVAYATATWLVIRYSISHLGSAALEGERLASVINNAGMRLLYLFLLLSFAFVLLDQILVRREFGKQMKMSRRELTRESKEREGEPRLKHKRKQLHHSFVQQAQGVEQLPGSDVLIVNPEHFAVALRYDADEMIAPMISAKGRNNHAARLKQRAHQLGIPIIARPPLARALFRECDFGQPIPGGRFEEVAEIYHALMRARGGEE